MQQTTDDLLSKHDNDFSMWQACAEKDPNPWWKLNTVLVLIRSHAFIYYCKLIRISPVGLRQTVSWWLEEPWCTEFIT